MVEQRVKHIRSNDNPQYKRLKRLANSARERRTQGQTLIDGMHLLEALRESGGRPDLLVLREGSDQDPDIAASAARFDAVPTIMLSPPLFDALSPTEHPTGVLGLMAIPPATTRIGNCGVLLEAVQDPGNVGSILRTAAAAGIDAVYLSSGCAEAWSPKALRGGMGAHFVIAIHEQQDLASIAGSFDTVVAASLTADVPIFDVDLTGRVAFLFGNEGAGLTPAALAAATQKVKVPMPGKIESLNVAAAAAVCLFERVRQLRRNVALT